MPITGFQLSDQFYNVPGVAWVNFCELEGVNVIPPDTSSVITTAITLGSGYAWKRGEFVCLTPEFKAVQVKSGAGDVWDVTVSGFYPKLQPAMTNQFWQMKDGRYLVIVKDQNGYKRLVGNKYGGAEFSVTEGTAVLGGIKLSGYDIVFNWRCTRPPLFYLAEVDEAILIPEDEVFSTAVTGAAVRFRPTTVTDGYVEDARLVDGLAEANIEVKFNNGELTETVHYTRDLANNRLLAVAPFKWVASADIYVKIFYNG